MLAHFHQIYTTNGGGAEGEEGDGLKLTRNICKFSITRGKIVGRVSLFYPTWFPFIRIYIFIYLFLRDNVIKSDLWKSAVTTVCITAWGEGGGEVSMMFLPISKNFVTSLSPFALLENISQRCNSISLRLLSIPKIYSRE